VLFKTTTPEVTEAAGARAGGQPRRASWELGECAEIAEGRAVLKRLGGGSLYEVYLVWDEHLHAICVAKVVRPDQTDDDHALREIREEAELLERLRHPVIVRSFDAVLEGPRPHLLLEHLEGPTLRRLVKRGGPLPLQQLLPLALSIAGSLHYMHREGFVHLDVKPDNIVMGVPPRLIDLSIARSRAQAAEVRRPLGTDAYMAPEQCDPKRRPGAVAAPADVWGLGATLHHALSGSRPFPRQKGARESGVPELRFPQLVHHAELIPEHLPVELRTLVVSMLAPSPHMRPSAAEVAARLEPLIAELPRRMKLSRRGRVL
jgi:serine/threonine protein kinase